MNYIACDEGLVFHFFNNYPAGKSMVYQFAVFENDRRTLLIEMHMKLFHAQFCEFVKLRFIDVKEYLFYHRNSNDPYCTGQFNLSKEKDLFRLSFNPVQQEKLTERQNQAFIFSSSIEGFSFEGDL
ncbi:MAG: hypothetical protein H0X41_12110 [Chitinophagaceae bacterium]|nr:hypothetical protein [Chitinophagaceae bacterium]